MKDRRRTVVEHRDVIVIGGGVAGLGVAPLLNGLRPYLRGDIPERLRAPQLAALLHATRDNLLRMDLSGAARVGINSFDLFRLLHHPQKQYLGLDSYPMAFRQEDPLDWLLLTDDPVGGLWNDVARNQLTLSPAHWMEVSAFPIARFFDEREMNIDPDALIVKQNLVAYYHAVPQRLGLTDRIRVGWRVETMKRGQDERRRFALSVRHLDSGEVRDFTAESIIYAVGPRTKRRHLGVSGEFTQPYVIHHYDHFDELPGQRVLVVGGGRSADWAATELHDAGRDVIYVMRQPAASHQRLIMNSQFLPYYVHIKDILQDRDRTIDTRYETHIREFRDQGTVLLDQPNGQVELQVDHAVLEIGAQPDYDLLAPWGNLSLADGHDPYRFQVPQMRVHPHSYESIDIPGLYPAGFLAEGLGISVLSMHATCFPIVADILAKKRSD